MPDFYCGECENIYDTQWEAEACAEADRATEQEPAPHDDSHDYTYSDPRWDRWESGR